MNTGLVYDPFYHQHDTGDHPECAARLDVVQMALREWGLLEKMTPLRPRNAIASEVCLVHSPRYFDIARKDVQFGTGELSTGDTSVSELSFEVALRAVGGVLAAVDAVVKGEVRNAFCAVRPPGHHATPVKGMGFCVFNNIAIAARYAQKKYGVGKVLIVDWDVHHGNGTQEAFYHDDSVLFFSGHQHPWYPGTGKREETGHGRGLGYTVNSPLPAGSGLNEMMGEIETRLENKVASFRPDLVLISAGFDGRVEDPLGRLRLTDADFVVLTRRVKAWAHDYAGDRIVSILEGGYNLRTLGTAVAGHVAALLFPGVMAHFRVWDVL